MVWVPSDCSNSACTVAGWSYLALSTETTFSCPVQKGKLIPIVPHLHASRGEGSVGKDHLLMTEGDTGSMAGRERNTAIIWDHFLFIIWLELSYEKVFLLCSVSMMMAAALKLAPPRHTGMYSSYLHHRRFSSTQTIPSGISGICFHYRAAVITCRL